MNDFGFFPSHQPNFSRGGILQTNFALKYIDLITFYAMFTVWLLGRLGVLTQNRARGREK